MSMMSWFHLTVESDVPIVEGPQGGASSRRAGAAAVQDRPARRSSGPRAVAQLFRPRQPAVRGPDRDRKRLVQRPGQRAPSCTTRRSATPSLEPADADHRQPLVDHHRPRRQGRQGRHILTGAGAQWLWRLPMAARDMEFLGEFESPFLDEELFAEGTEGEQPQPAASFAEFFGPLDVVEESPRRARQGRGDDGGLLDGQEGGRRRRRPRRFDGRTAPGEHRRQRRPLRSARQSGRARAQQQEIQQRPHHRRRRRTHRFVSHGVGAISEALRHRADQPNGRRPLRTSGTHGQHEVGQAAREGRRREAEDRFRKSSLEIVRRREDLDPARRRTMARIPAPAEGF